MRGDVGEIGMAEGSGERTDDGKLEASGVGSTSSGSLSTGDVAVGVESEVLTEPVRWTCLRGDLPKPCLEGVLKLNVLSGNDALLNDISITGPGLSTETGLFRRAVALSAAEKSMPASSADTLTRPRLGTELLRCRDKYGRVSPGRDGIFGSLRGTWSVQQLRMQS